MNVLKKGKFFFNKKYYIIQNDYFYDIYFFG